MFFLGGSVGLDVGTLPQSARTTMVGPSSIKGSGVRDRVLLLGVVGHGDDRAALLRNGGITVAGEAGKRL